MGLTGIILQATIKLKKVNSKWIKQTTIKTKNLSETFEAFEKYGSAPYSVAWLDGLAKGDSIGRSLLMTGQFAEDGDLSYNAKTKFNIPFNFPSFLLNKQTIKAFNNLYYRKAKSRVSKQKVGIDSFFYPLDSLNNWNRLYGKKGFIQYQFILPKTNSSEGTRKILKKINNSEFFPSLVVLKLHAEENENYLSFPMEGYSLALDFKMQPGLADFLHTMSDIVTGYGGRIYLTKDAIMSRKTFEMGYPQLDKFKEIRKKYKLDETFNSHQSKRLGL